MGKFAEQENGTKGKKMCRTPNERRMSVKEIPNPKG